MDDITKKKIQRYEQTRITKIMGSIEDITGIMFQESHPELYEIYETEIIDHIETRAKIARFRCKLDNVLTNIVK